MICRARPVEHDLDRALISIAIITSEGPPISAGVMKNPMASMNTISEPDTTPCTGQRKVIRVNA